EVLQPYLIPFLYSLPDHGQQYQIAEDNLGVHCSALTTNFYRTHDITKLKWLARSSDMYPVENVWHMLKL
ncbi:hypothetical protein C7212DRAFT_206212, partial [Tuber magnatum]